MGAGHKAIAIYRAFSYFRKIKRPYGLYEIGHKTAGTGDKQGRSGLGLEAQRSAVLDFINGGAANMIAEFTSIKDKYMRLRDELWFKTREWLEDLDCQMVEDEELMAELCAVKYAYTSTGKIKVESKDDLKKRGVRSPDLADAFVLTFAEHPATAGWYGD